MMVAQTRNRFKIDFFKTRCQIVFYFNIKIESEVYGSNPPCRFKTDLKKKPKVKSISILILNWNFMTQTRHVVLRKLVYFSLGLGFHISAYAFVND